MRVVLFAAALLLAAPVAVHAEDAHPTVRVGDGTLDGTFLQPYNNAWFYSVETADGVDHPQGIWSDHLQWTTENGKAEKNRVTSGHEGR